MRSLKSIQVSLPTLFGVLGLFHLGSAHAQVGRTDDAATPSSYSNMQGPWDGKALEENVAQWNTIVQNRPDDVAALYSLFQSERQTALAAGNGRMNSAAKSRLEARAKDIEQRAPGSWGASLANYYLQFPAETAFRSLGEAEAIAPDSPELIAPRMSKALRDGDQVALEKAAADLYERGQVAPGLWQVAEDVLSSLEQDAVVLLAGEMDAYPLITLQQRTGARPDVLAVDVRALEDAAYRQRVWTAANGAGPSPAAGPGWAGALAKKGHRPVYLGLSLDRSWIDPLREELVLTGLAFRIGNDPVPPEVLGQLWNAMHRTPEAGPLSWNYLLPGSVLLRHYRATEDEGRAAFTEQELRRIAGRVGATNTLYQLGVLEH
ncbi:MAG: hypothetical protein KA352_15080 [Flavobacteriales bacterium]|nr:hypothetical protein [Flavobacteriales bacterium]